ncbi:MAG: ferric reductase-like transmembrane domain-containing protein [Zoogloeaceae bacterium]|jgi:predicted ferric reductase|nr:ferric reductase-like transmembrane domain-containing protein [Zoogloeaceae bacterium]
MKPIQITLAGFLLLLTALWCLADALFPQPLTYFAFRKVFVQYSGLVGVGAMSLAMFLAARPRWLEARLNGLDKMYRLHKWLGVTALCAGITHWWFALGTKWMVGWGWLVRPERKGNGSAALSPETLEGIFSQMRHTAEDVGQWTFYAALLLLVLALVKRFPYRWFAKTHYWLAALYLLLVWHSVILLEFSYWKQPVGILAALLLLTGTLSAAWILTGMTGAGRVFQGRVAQTRHHPESKTLAVKIALPEWPGHAAGQFAFLTTEKNEGAHPYTLASAWRPDTAREKEISFLIKELGDHTRQLPARLTPETQVKVEGPYGAFTFSGQGKRQIWIGAGIGITPFLARLEELAARRQNEDSPAESDIDLFHPTSAYPPEFKKALEDSCAAAGARLHPILDGRDSPLTGADIRKQVPEWREADVWFCGPAAFGRALRNDLTAQGFPSGRFHQECFEMR